MDTADKIQSEKTPLLVPPNQRWGSPPSLALDRHVRKRRAGFWGAYHSRKGLTSTTLGVWVDQGNRKMIQANHQMDHSGKRQYQWITQMIHVAHAASKLSLPSMGFSEAWPCPTIPGVSCRERKPLAKALERSPSASQAIHVDYHVPGGDFSTSSPTITLVSSRLFTNSW